MYKDGWWLAMRTERIPWVLTPAALEPYAPGVWNPDDDPVELYYLPDDFSQAHDLASEHPDKVEELRALFWSEAETILGAATPGPARGVLRRSSLRCRRSRRSSSAATSRTSCRA